METLNVGILLFDNVEVLDFAGPFEVFSRTRLQPGVEARRSEEGAPFQVFTVARTRDPITATGGLTVVPRHGFADAPRIDLLGSLDAGVTVERTSRVVDDGVITSAGVASGMDMAFYIVETLCGRAVADETARYIEYRR